MKTVKRKIMSDIILALSMYGGIQIEMLGINLASVYGRKISVTMQEHR